MHSCDNTKRKQELAEVRAVKKASVKRETIVASQKKQKKNASLDTHGGWEVWEQ